MKMTNMKRMAALTLAVWLGFATLGFAEQVQVGIKGMVCAFCAQGIKKKFKAEKSVSDVKVSLEEKRVSLTFKEGQTLGDERIEKIIEDAGYNVTGIERKTE